MKIKILCVILAVILTMSAFAGVSVFADSATKNVVKTLKIEDFEGFDTGLNFNWSKNSYTYDYHSYGSYSATVTVSDEVAYSGNKSAKLPKRCDSGCSLKIINLFEPVKQNVGTTYDISFKIYADKNAGVYKNSAASIEECVPFSNEELLKSEGTFINLIMAGPDGDNYKHRSNYGKALGSTFVKWNTWTEINTQFTLKDEHLDDGSTEIRTNPAVNAIRIFQTDIDYSINQGLCDTFYIDDIIVETVGASVLATSKNKDNTEIDIHTDYYKPETQYKARSIACEYLEGKLVNIKSGNPFTVKTTLHNYPVRHTFSMSKKYRESDVVVFVVSSDYANPICRSRNLTFLPGSVVDTKVDELKEYARDIIAASTATYKDAIEETPVIDGNKYYRSVGASYTQSGKPDETRFNENLVVRKTCDSYIKFDVPDTTDKVAYAYLRVYSKKLSNEVKGGVVSVYDAGNDWVEETLTHNNALTPGEKIAELMVDQWNVPYYFDITDYINKTLPQGKKQYSFVLSADDDTYVAFLPERNTSGKYYKPSLIFEGVGKTREQIGLSAFAGDGFVDVLHTVDEETTDPCDKEKVRVLSSLTSYNPKATAPNLSQYGGWIDGGKYEATGFFRTQLIDGRWWFIDPLGYKYIDMGVAQTGPRKNSDIQKTAFESTYGTDEVWAEKVGDKFRSYGFNSMGPWSNIDPALSAAKPLNQTVLDRYFLAGYDKNGWAQDGVLEVFSPAFETFCEEMVKQRIVPFVDNPHIVGWYTDNEPPAGSNMLKNTLSKSLDTNDDYYDYTVAWEWFKQRHGENAAISDITHEDNEAWIEFAYDRYMQIVTKVIRKYDKNHMIFGPKLDTHNRSMFRSVGRYADAIGYDYYPNAFTPDRMVVNEWYKWGGKPLMNAEWYSKGRDACDMGLDITNVAGVGYEVATQKDRGYYYQTFVLGMLDSNVFVGWQWFKYMDNDPTDLSQDLSNIDANKGIYKRNYEPWNEFLSMIRDMNFNVYDLTEYMDK